MKYNLRHETFNKEQEILLNKGFTTENCLKRTEDIIVCLYTGENKTVEVATVYNIKTKKLDKILLRELNHKPIKELSSLEEL